MVRDQLIEKLFIEKSTITIKMNCCLQDDSQTHKIRIQIR